jgi:hypothetical protein
LWQLREAVSFVFALMHLISAKISRFEGRKISLILFFANFDLSAKRLIFGQN